MRKIAIKKKKTAMKIFIEGINKTFRVLWFAIFSLIFASVSTGINAEGATALLTNVTGDVEFSRDGLDWKAVTRNKLVFDDYNIRTLKNSSVKILFQDEGVIHNMKPNSHVVIRSTEISVIKGGLEDPESSADRLFSSLSNRFRQAQQYTTVRRGLAMLSPRNFKTAKKYTLSSEFPDIVWESIGKAYSFQLIIDEKVFDVANGESGLVRFGLELEPGIHQYEIKVLKEGKLQNIPVEQRRGVINWLDGERELAIQKKMTQMSLLTAEDPYCLGLLLDDEGMTVAAMDYYEKFFDQFPDEFELKPPLLMVYHSLNLLKMHSKKTREYNKQLSQ